MGSESLKVIVTAAVKDAIRDLGLVDKSINKTAATTEDWAKKLGKVGSNLSKYLTLPIAAAAAASVKLAADYEKQRLAFGVMIKDVAKGNALFEELKKFAAETPLELDDISKATSTLLAFGSSAGDVIEEMRVLGDVGQGDGETLKTLADAYGKLKSKGVAHMKELNRFTEAGVPIVKELADGYGVTTEELMKMVEKGEVGFQQVDAVLRKITGSGGQFENMMRRMAQTTAGKFSTAMDNLKNSAAELGTTLLPLANQIIDKVSDMAEKFSALDEGSRNAILTMAGIAALAGPVATMAGSVLQLAAAVQKVNWASLASGVAKLGPIGLAIGATAAVAAGIDQAATRKYNDDAVYRYDTIVDDLKMANKEQSISFEAVKNIAHMHELSLGRVIQIAKQEKLITEEREWQLTQDAKRISADAARAEAQKLMAQAAESAPASTDLSPIFSLEGDDKSWREWWKKYTGQDIAEKTGGEAAHAYIDSVVSTIRKNQDIAEALGQPFDSVSVFSDSAKNVLELMKNLVSIDVGSIDEPFTMADAGIQELIRYCSLYIDILPQIAQAAEPVIATSSRLSDLIDQEAARLNEATVLWGAYYEALERVKEMEPLMLSENRDLELARLKAIIVQLEKQLGIQKAIEEESVTWESELSKVGESAKKILIDAALPLVEGITQAVISSEDFGSAMENIGEAVAQSAASIMSTVAPLLLEAGLTLIVKGGEPGLVAGLAMVAASGLVAIGGAILGSSSSSYQSKYDYQSLILDKEQAISDARVDLLETELDTLEEKWDKYLEDLGKSLDIEFDVLRDQWERNLISTEAYIAGANAINAKYKTAETTAATETDTKQDEIDTIAAAAKALDDARTAKLGALAEEALTLETQLQGMSAMDRFSGKYGIVAEALKKIDERIAVVESATSLDAIASAAHGADFITHGPQLMMVGDNASGRERVTVAPLTAAERSGSAGTTIIQIGDVYGIDDFAEKMEAARRRLAARGRLSA